MVALHQYFRGGWVSAKHYGLARVTMVCGLPLVIAALAADVDILTVAISQRALPSSLETLADGGQLVSDFTP